MLHQTPRISASAPVHRAPLHRLFHDQGPGLRNAAALLGGDRGARLVDDLSRRLEAEPVPSRSTLQLAADLLALLALEFIHDPERDKAALFAAIDPTEPVVAEVCRLTDELRSALQSAGPERLGSHRRAA